MSKANLKSSFLQYFSFGNYTFLLVTLITLFIVISLVTELNNSIIFNIFLSLILFASVHSIILNKKYFWLSLILVVIALIINWIIYLYPNLSIIHTASIIKPIFLFYTMVIIIEHVLKARKVTLDILMGSVCAFLLLGISFALLYSYIFYFIPDAYISSGGVVNQNDLFYFSFTTITTLGYGDILPNIPITKTLCILEAIIGWFYMATLVAYLVSLHIIHSVREDYTNNE